MKKYSSLLIAASVTFALGGCASTTNEPSSQTASTSLPAATVQQTVTPDVAPQNSAKNGEITLKQIKSARSLSLKNDLIMEYRLSQACMNGFDFYEGVRAVLVDKDFKPNWSPIKIEDVSDDIVLSHFKSLGKNDLKI